MFTILYLRDEMTGNYNYIGTCISFIEAVKSCLSYAIRWPNDSYIISFKLIKDEHEFIINIKRSYLNEDILHVESALFGDGVPNVYHLSRGINEEECISNFVDELFYNRALVASEKQVFKPRYTIMNSDEIDWDNPFKRVIKSEYKYIVKE